MSDVNRCRCKGHKKYLCEYCAIKCVCPKCGAHVGMWCLNERLKDFVSKASHYTAEKRTKKIHKERRLKNGVV